MQHRRAGKLNIEFVLMNVNLSHTFHHSIRSLGFTRIKKNIVLFYSAITHVFSHILRKQTPFAICANNNNVIKIDPEQFISDITIRMSRRSLYLCL